MNKSKNLLILVVVLSCFTGWSQTKEDALRDAKIASNATLSMDFKTLLNYTHPNVLNIMGGEEKGLELLKSTFNSMTDQGFVFEKADVISVSDIVFEQDEYRCYVEGFNQMKMPGMRIKSKSYLLGFFDSDKKIWYFIEADKVKNKALMDQIFPGFKTQMDIPEDTMETEEIKEEPEDKKNTEGKKE